MSDPIPTAQTHLSDDTLLRMLTAPLNQPEISESFWEVHLSECPLCRQRLDRLADSAGAMGLLGPVGGMQQIDQVAAHLVADSVTWLTGMSAGKPALAMVDEDGIRNLLGETGSKELGRLGGMKVVELLGQGGMGIVLRAHDRELQRDVAVKILHPAYRESETVRDRFRREARAIAALTHENVIPIHHVAEDKGLLYFVMPLADHSLSDWLKSEDAPNSEERLRIALAAAKGLSAAHKAGIIHRDIKPANLLIHAGMRDPSQRLVWLADFGLARREDECQSRATGDGTPGFVAPEIEAGGESTARSDLYSLGVLYETLFPEGCINRPTDLIRRLKASKPADRPDDAAAVVRELENRLKAEMEKVATDRLKRRLYRVAAVLAIVFGLPTAFVVGSDLIAGTNWVNRGLAALHGQTVFAIKGRFGVSRGLRLMLNETRDGDVIEVIGTQPIEVAPLILKGRTITLRAAAGRLPGQSRPTLMLAPDSLDSLIWIDNGTLIIDGLELLQQVEHSTRRPGYTLSPLIRIGGGNLTIQDSIIRRTGTSRGYPAFLVLSRMDAPLIRIVDSILEDEHGICVARSSFKPAPHESIEISNSRFNSRRWLYIDPPEEGRESPSNVIPEIHFAITQSAVRAESALTLGKQAGPDQIRIELNLDKCRIETSGPAIVSGIDSVESVRRVLSVRDRGTVLASPHTGVIQLAEDLFSPFPPINGDPAAVEATWRGLFEGPANQFEDTQWVSPPIFQSRSPEDW